ncbi:lipoprotein [Enterobacteriaceae bacterium LUAb1]
MRAAFHTVIALFFIVLLPGCNQFTRYAISEQQINQSLQKRNNYEKDIGIDGLVKAHIVLTSLRSEIGREEPNKVTLSGHAKIEITSLFGPQKADMTLKMRTQPAFDREQSAIYLRDLEITDITLQPTKMESVLKALMPYLNESLQIWFNHHPAYVLSSEHSKAELLAKKLAKGLEVKPGELIILFTE